MIIWWLFALFGHAALTCAIKIPTNMFYKLPVTKNNEEYSIFSFSSDTESNKVHIRDKLYQAYNELHALAQEHKKPFDSPAVIIVGYEGSGKSSLLEALMGFQFNQVGGAGTTTRRPIALQMQYKKEFTTPQCYLTLNGKEERRSLEDIQAYIESENKRLERDPTRAYDSEEIRIRMEYRHCPNLLIIDTPGMLHPPKGKNLDPKQRAMVQKAQEAQNLVLSKIRVKDYIILCVESDWNHATTRNIVRQVDPDFSRTVLVATKLDHKLSHLEPSELNKYLTAPDQDSQFRHRLGGPFFTTIPPGRVGAYKDFNSDDVFVSSLKQTETWDRAQVSNKLGETAASPHLDHIGVSRLRSFLEKKVEERYRMNVEVNLPKLAEEKRSALKRLSEIEHESAAISPEKLHQASVAYLEVWVKSLREVIEGTVKLDPSKDGETMLEVQQRNGMLLPDGQQCRVDLATHVDNADKKLYGGGQYYRDQQELAATTRYMAPPAVTLDEIANAVGMGNTNNGVDHIRAACVIAMTKAVQQFYPVLTNYKQRTVSGMNRNFLLIEKIVLQDCAHIGQKQLNMLSQHYKKTVQEIFEQFVEEKAETCFQMCWTDLQAQTGYVTWDTEDRGAIKGYAQSGPVTPGRVVQIWELKEQEKREKERRQLTGLRSLRNAVSPSRRQSHNPLKSIFSMLSRRSSIVNNKITVDEEDVLLGQWNAANGGGNGYGATVMEIEEESAATAPSEMISQDSAGRVALLAERHLATSNGEKKHELINDFVELIISDWKELFIRYTSMKFNCFFLKPFINDFSSYLREKLQHMQNTASSGELFDQAEAKRKIKDKINEAQQEINKIDDMEKKFLDIQKDIRSAAAAGLSGNANFESTDSSNDVTVD